MLRKFRLLSTLLVSLCVPAAILAADAKPGTATVPAAQPAPGKQTAAASQTAASQAAPAAKTASEPPFVPAIKPAKDLKPAPAGMTAAQVVEKHIAARGGLQAWHGLQSMAWNGKMDVGFGDSAARSERYVSNAMVRSTKQRREAIEKAQDQQPAEKQVQLPFVLEMKRPDKSRIELEFAGKTAVQVFDGKNGWMKRPYLNRDTWEPFSAEQAKSQVGKWDLEGPLVDYAAKGTKVALEGLEPVDGKDAYRLKLTMKNGEVQHAWIDTQSYLDVKVEGIPRRMDGRMRTVWVYHRDFRSVQGLMVPFMLETAVDGYRDTHRMVLEKVGLNPQLDDSLFTKPHA
jgi:outer membrane lipoprotein-sorting protein